MRSPVIDWLVPGLMTIEGQPTRDADTIAQVFLDRGFVVMRWQAIRRNDPQFAKTKLMMDVGSFAQTVEQAHQALAAFRAKNVVPEDHIFLVGHSLGAFRAAMLIAKNKKLPGVVMLAGAKLVCSKLEIVRKIVAQATTDWNHQPHHPLDARARYEYVVRMLGKHRKEWEVLPEQTTRGMPWPADVIAQSRTPTLLIVGSLDKQFLLASYLFTDFLRRQKHPDYTGHVYENLGHNLGLEKPGEVRHEKYGVLSESRTGPIDPAVVQALVDWIDQRAK